MSYSGPIPSPWVPAPVGPPLPALVYAPARPVRRDGRTDVVYEVRCLSDGTKVLPVFTTRERLVDVLGPAQPWAQAPLRAIRAVMGAAGVDSVQIDPEISSQAWRWTPEQLAEFGEERR